MRPLIAALAVIAGTLSGAIVAQPAAAEITPGAPTARASKPAKRAACPHGQLRVAGGCTNRTAARTRVAGIARRAIAELGIRGAILRIDTGRRPLISRGFGNSMAGVPATPRMHFRIGSIAIPHLITLLLQLQDEGRLSLDDPLARFLPDLPDADRITLRMLANNTSGYADWIQGNPAFVDLLLADVFKQWTPSELLAHAFARPAACEPGRCFHYAHTNYAVLSQVIAKVTGRSVGALMHERIFKPLGLRQTAISRRPAMPGPALHSYISARGPYEDSTFWSPSWTIGAGTVMSATVGDVARTARAVGSGELLSAAASRQRFAPATVGLGPFTPDLYYGLGIVVDNGWWYQNPMLNGYTGIMAYMPSRKLSVALVATATPRGAATEISLANHLFARLTAYLSPGRQISPRG